MSVIRPLNSKHACNPNVHFDSSRLNTAVWDTVSGRETLLCLGLLGVGGKSRWCLEGFYLFMLQLNPKSLFSFQNVEYLYQMLKKKTSFFFLLFLSGSGYKPLKCFIFSKTKGESWMELRERAGFHTSFRRKRLSPRKETNRPFFATRKQIRSLCVFFLKGKQD